MLLQVEKLEICKNKQKVTRIQARYIFFIMRFYSINKGIIQQEMSCPHGETAIGCRNSQIIGIYLYPI